MHLQYDFSRASTLLAAASFLSVRVDAAVAFSWLCNCRVDRRHLKCVPRSHVTSHAVVEAAVLPPRLREATQPAPPAYLTDAHGSFLPSEIVGHPRRCADAPAMRHSCARHRGGDGSVEAERTHSNDEKKVPRQRVGISEDTIFV